MNEFSSVADQMKEMLISEFIRKNPGMKRAEITTKLVNGRVVVEAVGNVIKNCAGRIKKSVPFTFKEQSLLKELAKGGDERYAECLDSIGSSKRYVDWLYESKFTAFGDRDKVDTIEFLDAREQICGKRSLDILNAKKKFVQLMKDKVQASKSLIQTLTMEYVQAMTGQMKAQGAIFNKEADLGNLFTSHTEKFIQSKIQDSAPKLDQKSLITVAKAYQLASSQQVSPLEIPKKIQTKEFAAALDQIKNKLVSLREQVVMLQKVLQFMEALVEEMMKAKGEDLTGEPPKKDESGPSGPRMAFSTRRR